MRLEDPRLDEILTEIERVDILRRYEAQFSNQKGSFDPIAAILDAKK